MSTKALEVLAEMDASMMVIDEYIGNFMAFTCTIWMLMAFLGYTMVESSLTRQHNHKFVFYRNASIMMATFFFFFLVGYYLSTDADGGLIGKNQSKFEEMTTSKQSDYLILFSANLIAVQILNSATAERVYLGVNLSYTVFITVILFPLTSSWVWGDGWLKELGFIDFSGAGVVHAVSGFGCLIATLILGPRLEIHGKS